MKISLSFGVELSSQEHLANMILFLVMCVLSFVKIVVPQDEFAKCALVNELVEVGEVSHTLRT